MEQVFVVTIARSIEERVEQRDIFALLAEDIGSLTCLSVEEIIEEEVDLGDDDIDFDLDEPDCCAPTRSCVCGADPDIDFYSEK